MSERVAIPNADAPKPTFHKIGSFYPSRFSGHRQVTACGMALVDEMFGINSIRRERAELFAVACKRCYRTEAEQ